MGVHAETKALAPDALPAEALGIRCPSCGKIMGALKRAAPSLFDVGLRCNACGMQVRNQKGVWSALAPARESHFQQFVKEYQFVRAAEGRGSNSAAYYLALPFRDLSGRNQAQWAIRARSFSYIENRILPTLERTMPALDVLDLGAGNGWLDYRLALRGHRPVAVDLLVNSSDGLGAASHYLERLPTLFPRFQAEFTRLPFANSQFDCAIFNASFHYSENYDETLAEAIRCLRPGGWVVISDSPWYHRDESGRRMLEERREAFVAQFGFPSDSIPSQEYLTDERMAKLANRFALSWQIHRPYYGWRWSLRPIVAKLKHRREPSEFRIYVAQVKTQ